MENMAWNNTPETKITDETVGLSKLDWLSSRMALRRPGKTRETGKPMSSKRPETRQSG
jgi:hypothetical protein